MKDRILSALYDADSQVSDLGIEVPRWIEQDITTGTVAGIVEGGCDSGSYMPAVTYHDALETMGKHGDEVVDYLDGNAEPMSFDPSSDSWAGFACRLLSMAVEMWAHSVAEECADRLDDGDDEGDQ